MNHGDLFSGIGGFALAASWRWGNEYNNVFHSDIEKYACKVYHKHFPTSRCLGDIKKVNWTEYAGKIDLLTGGFPCQPFSVAGKRKGKADDRSLWHEMFRAIQETKPTWIIGENVGGFVEVGLEESCVALEGEGYEVQPIIIPACAVNAPHRRDRVWIVANLECGIGESNRIHGVDTDVHTSTSSRFGNNSGSLLSITESKGFSKSGGVDTDDDCERKSQSKRIKQIKRGRVEYGNEINTYTKSSESQKRMQARRRSGRTSVGSIKDSWNKSWIEVATEFCRVDDGVSHRVDRLKGLGNAIVPQVAYEIMLGMDV